MPSTINPTKYASRSPSRSRRKTGDQQSTGSGPYHDEDLAERRLVSTDTATRESEFLKELKLVEEEHRDPGNAARHGVQRQRNADLQDR